MPCVQGKSNAVALAGAPTKTVASTEPIGAAGGPVALGPPWSARSPCCRCRGTPSCPGGLLLRSLAAGCRSTCSAGLLSCSLASSGRSGCSGGLLSCSLTSAGGRSDCSPGLSGLAATAAGESGPPGYELRAPLLPLPPSGAVVVVVEGDDGGFVGEARMLVSKVEVARTVLLTRLGLSLPRLSCAGAMRHWSSVSLPALTADRDKTPSRLGGDRHLS